MADSKDVSTSLPSSSPPNTTPDPGFNPAGTFSAQWSNIFSYATGRMSRRTYDAWHAHLSLKTEAADCAACEKQRDYLLAKSPLVQYMQGQIRQLGGDLHSGNIRCLRCEKRQGGGFNPKYGIVICANEIRGKSKTEDTLVHEMIHAWDHLRWRVDWDDLRHAACSEIRASTLSGECRWSREFFGRKVWKITGQFQQCVRRRATLSVNARPFCPNDVAAATAVNSVWESCFRDTRPFEEIFR